MTKLEAFHAAEQQSPAEANRLLFTWLSDDDERAKLYRCLLNSSEVLKFQSRADITERSTLHDSVFHQEVYLLAKRQHVQRALTTPEEFSNSPYRALGSGTFMLGLDDADHEKQRAFAREFLHYDAPTIDALASVAFKAAAVLPSKQREFDLVDVCEQVALHFVGFLFGFEEADHFRLGETMRAAFLGLNHQIVGRHFVSEPATIPNASIAMGLLLGDGGAIDRSVPREKRASGKRQVRADRARAQGTSAGDGHHHGVATIRAGVEKNRQENFAGCKGRLQRQRTGGDRRRHDRRHHRQYSGRRLHCDVSALPRFRRHGARARLRRQVEAGRN